MTLTEFLLARIAEDEVVAHDWLHHGARKVKVHGGGTGYERLVSPNRVLAECEAKRRIIDAAWDDQVRIASEWGSGEGRQQMSEAGDNPPILECLAIPYADHPDCREEWRP